jgi:hypothetical protein
MSDGLQLQSIALPDITELQAATAAATINQAQRTTAAGGSDSDSDWSLPPSFPPALQLIVTQPFTQACLCRSDSGDNGHGPPLRQSVIAPALPDLHKSREDERLNAFASADDLEHDGPTFSATLHANVAHSVQAPQDSDEDDSEVRASDTVRASGAVSASQHGASDSLVLKAGWLRKLARFGRDLRRYHQACVPLHSMSPAPCRHRVCTRFNCNAQCRYFVIAPIDPDRLMPQLQRDSQSAARRGHAIFYYTDQPQDLLKDTPHGIITLEASTTVEPFSVGSKYLFCLRLLHAQQQRKRFTSKET